MKGYILLCFLCLHGLRALGQANALVQINHSFTLNFQPGNSVEQRLSPTESDKFVRALQQNKAVVLTLKLTGVAASLAPTLKVGTQMPDNTADEAGGKKTLIFTDLNWNPSENKLILPLRRSDNFARMDLVLLAPASRGPASAPQVPASRGPALRGPALRGPALRGLSSTPQAPSTGTPAPVPLLEADKFDDQAYVLNACPDASTLQRPYGRKWAFLYPWEKTRMIVININPLRNNVSVDAAALAFNTDPGAVRSPVDAVLGTAVINAASAEAVNDSITSKPTAADKLWQLLQTGNQLSTKITELRKEPCLTVEDINRLNQFLQPHEQILKDYPDDVWLDIGLKRLATGVTSMVASVTVSITASMTASPPNQAEIDRLNDLKDKLNDLANYGKREGVGKSIYALFNTLKQVPDGRVLKTDWIEVKDHRNVDVIQFTMTTKNRLDTSAAPVSRNYDVWIVGRAKLDFSAGLIATGLSDQTVALRDEVISQTRVVDGVSKTNDVVRQQPIAERRDIVTFALATLAHLSWRTPLLRGSVSFGLTLGGGLTSKGRPLLLGGGSILLGHQQRIVLSGGAAMGTQKELSIRYDDPANYYASAPAEFTYVDRTRLKWFAGVTFNFGQNVKKETIIGKSSK